MTVLLRIGVIGVLLTLLLNVAGLLLFRRPSAEFFTPAWWSSWFVNFSTWIVVALVGLVARLRKTSRPG